MATAHAPHSDHYYVPNSSAWPIFGSVSLFTMMLGSIKSEVTRVLLTVEIRSPEALAAAEELEAPRNMQFQHADFAAVETAGEPEAETDVAVAERPQPFVRPGEKVGRNDPCPCGSGKKYKQCHGRLT